MSVKPSQELEIKGQTWIWRGQTIHYREGQSAQKEWPVLVLIHGFGASAGHWQRLMPDLMTHANVYALDLLGFGQSAKPPFDYKTDLWRDQVRDFCQQVVQRPVVLVGNSLGGYVSLSVAVDYPEGVKGVVLLNSAGSWRQGNANVGQGQSQGSWVRGVVGGLLRQSLVSWGLFHYLRQPQVIRKTLAKVYVNQAAITDELVEMIRRPSEDPGAAQVFISLMREQQQGRPVDELLQRLVRPLLLIWGERDPWINAAQRSQLFHQHYHDLTEHFVDAGHCPHDDRPELVYPLMRDWLTHRWAGIHAS
ncbi:MAG: alpha/beta fold hydrolase [Synechococcales cyanobacterium]